MIRKRFRKMNELDKVTWEVAGAIALAFVALFIATFRVSNFTSLFVILFSAIIVSFSVISQSWTRYFLLAVLAGILWLLMILRNDGDGLYRLLVIARFLLTGVCFVYFSTVVTQISQRSYIAVEKISKEREETLKKSQELVGRLSALIVVITAISTKATLKDVLTEGLKAAREALGADSGLIYSVRGESGEMSIVGSFGYSEEMLRKMKEKGIKDSSSCLACARREPIVVDDLLADDKCQSLAGVESGSSVCAPIISGDTLWGVLHLRRQEDAAFSKEEIQFVLAMTYQFGLAMERASLFEQVSMLAITDSLTGLYNYRKLERDLQGEVVRSKRYNHPFSFIMADIDDFKKFNDLYGHPLGDEVLRRVAEAIEGSRREADRVYRYGGEEFCVLLPETGWVEAVDVAERIRTAIESLTIKAKSLRKPLKVTLSLGIASFPDDSEEKSGIIASADAALYVAKESGKNRVVAFCETKERPLRRAHPDA
ncbi:MAG: sensor domain-containing diguanylate cyclase [Actinomycetota bacterium]|nr:sensor domain-containing diguanylate cyclase [Actinomycetota bacterium]